MTDLKELCSMTPLADNIEMLVPEHGFVSVSHLDRFRFNMFSDQLLKVQFEWSIDGVERHVTTSLRVGSKLWKSERVDVILPFVRYRIINETQQNVHSLILYTFAPGVDRPRHVCFKKEEEIPAVTERSTGPAPDPHVGLSTHTKGKRPWSILKSTSPKQAVLDQRLPSFIPEGILLVGDKGGKVRVLPKGNVGEYLMVLEDGPGWSLPYTPTQLSSESIQKMEERQWFNK